MCGTLHCVDLNERLEFGMESAAVQSKFYITDDESEGTSICHSVIVDLGLFSQDAGQSPNGAKCGTNKVRWLGSGIVTVILGVQAFLNTSENTTTLISVNTSWPFSIFQACLNQKCVPLERLYGVKCPYDCNNNGVSHLSCTLVQ